MYHYTYLITFPDAMQYVGMHSTTIHPELDTCYLGSGKALPPRNPQSCHKEILGIYATRQEAHDREILEILERNAVKSPKYYNLRIRTYDRHGSTLSEEHRKLISITQKGKDRKAYGKKYSGSGRTPAQIEGTRRMRQKQLGVKNPKKGEGNKGVKNHQFTPWYYITPTGEYHEVYDRLYRDVAPELGLTCRSLITAMSAENIGKQATSGKRKGWTFGKLNK